LRLFHRASTAIVIIVALALLGVFFYARRVRPGGALPTVRPISSVVGSPTVVIGPLTSPAATPGATAVGTVVPGPVPTATPSGPTRVYLPVVIQGGPPQPPAVAQVAPTATPIPGPPPPTPTPTPTRGPIRITKLGLGVYESGGAMLPILDEARPSVILLMDPTVDFAREVRRRFPKAFIVGRIFADPQPLDHPEQRGTAFADRVAQVAVPLKGVVNAWMSYNEVANGDDPANLIAYNAFQVAFAHRLQDHYGIAAVAGNDGPRSVRAEEYPQYFAEAISTSRYFGVHAYPDPGIKSLRDPAAYDQIFYYRKIHAALEAAGIKSGPFIVTEVGLYNGWRDVTSDTEMARDFVWYAEQMNQDSYTIGMAVFGLFLGDRWSRFNIDGSIIPTIMGDYNTVH